MQKLTISQNFMTYFMLVFEILYIVYVIKANTGPTIFLSPSNITSKAKKKYMFSISPCFPNYKVLSYFIIEKQKFNIYLFNLSVFYLIVVHKITK